MSGTPEPVICFKEDMGFIHCLSFCVRDNNFVSHLLAATEKGTVYFWNLETNQLQHKQNMGSSIQAIHCVNSNIITQDKVGTVNLWSVKGKSYELTKSRNCSSGYCKSIVVYDSLILANEDGSVEILNVYDLEKTSELTPDKESLGHIMILEKIIKRNEVYIMAGYETGNVVLWNINSAKPRGSFKLQEHLLSLLFDPVIGRGVCGNTSDILQIFTLDIDSDMERKPADVKAELSITNDGCNVAKLRPDREILVAGCSDGKVRVFSWKTLELRAILSQHKTAITDIQFSPHKVNYWKDNIMATCSADGVISLWSVYNSLKRR